MMKLYLLIVALFLFLELELEICEAFRGLNAGSFLKPRGPPILSSSALMGLKRNTKEEKRDRNLIYARKHNAGIGLIRRKALKEAKRAKNKKAELSFGREMFTHTTHEDWAEYNGFDGIFVATRPS